MQLALDWIGWVVDLAVAAYMQVALRANMELQIS